MGCGSSLPAIPFQQTVQGQLVNAAGQTTDAATLVAGKVKLVYFAGNQGEVGQFARVHLAPFIAAMKAKGSVQFEVILVSYDTDAAQFQEHLALSPHWWAVPLADAARATALKYLLNISGPPAVVVLDENDGVIANDGVDKVRSDFQGANFPWKPSKTEGLMSMAEDALGD